MLEEQHFCRSASLCGAEKKIILLKQSYKINRLTILLCFTLPCNTFTLYHYMFPSSRRFIARFCAGFYDVSHLWNHGNCTPEAGEGHRSGQRARHNLYWSPDAGALRVCVRHYRAQSIEPILTAENQFIWQKTKSAIQANHRGRPIISNDITSFSYGTHTMQHLKYCYKAISFHILLNLCL